MFGRCLLNARLKDGGLDVTGPEVAGGARVAVARQPPLRSCGGIGKPLRIGALPCEGGHGAGEVGEIYRSPWGDGVARFCASF